MILLYKGKSWVSKTIRWRTWGDYSHAAWWLRDGTVIESWHKGGVTHSDSPATIHKPGTEIDVFDFRCSVGARPDLAEAFLLQQVGKKYDFRPVISGFTFRLNREDPDKWFCSELDNAAAIANRTRLFSRIPNHKIDPSFLSYSRELVHVGTITTIDHHDFSFQTVDALLSTPLQGRGAEGGVGSPCLSSDLCPLTSGGLACP